jgi:hypothetical protein
MHGVKLHVVARQRSGTLPLPQQAGLTPGNENDLRALRRVLPNIEGGTFQLNRSHDLFAQHIEQLTDRSKCQWRTGLTAEWKGASTKIVPGKYSQSLHDSRKHFKLNS